MLQSNSIPIGSTFANIPASGSNDVLCLITWTPIIVNSDHECLVAMANHPLGQTLIVISGCGRIQKWDGPVEEIHPGDVVWFPPGEKHWHGATATTAMTHIAIQEYLEGKTANLIYGKLTRIGNKIITQPSEKTDAEASASRHGHALPPPMS